MTPLPSRATCRELRTLAWANVRLHLLNVARAVSPVSARYHWRQAKLYAAEARRWEAGA